MKKLILVFLYIFLGVSTRAQEIYVVSVGIADYQHINDLRFTINDVKTFNSVMSQYTQNIYTLVESQATHSGVIKEIRSVFALAKEDDTVIFFFSGHGYEGGFCSYDMRPNSFIGGISYKEMQILFRNCRAGRKIVIADACFSGGLSKQRTSLTVQSVRNSEVLFFLSSRFDETSLELPSGPNGLFTYYLAKGLTGEADSNRDQSISVEEIYDYVNGGVVLYADQIPHSQHPMMWGKCDKSMKVISWK